MSRPLQAIRIVDGIDMAHLENADTVAIARGQVVASSVLSGRMVRASAANNARNAIGLSVSSVNVGFSGDVQSVGIFVMSDWTAVIGTTHLTHGAKYFLSAIPGAGGLSPSPPPLSAAGQVVQLVGRAVNTTTLELCLSISIIL